MFDSVTHCIKGMKNLKRSAVSFPLWCCITFFGVLTKNRMHFKIFEFFNVSDIARVAVCVFIDFSSSHVFCDILSHLWLR